MDVDYRVLPYPIIVYTFITIPNIFLVMVNYSITSQYYNNKIKAHRIGRFCT